MPKLYYTETSCGGANFIAAHTAGVNMQCEQVRHTPAPPNIYKRTPCSRS